MFATIAEIFIAAPIGFAVGFAFGIVAANKIIVAPREKYKVVPRDNRDHSHERG